VTKGGESRLWLVQKMQMIKTIIGMLALGFVQMQAMGQVAAKLDSAKVPAFEGVIGYHIKYEGKIPPASKPYLPDSMTMFVGKNGLLYRYHGGKSADLQSQVIWDGEVQAFWLLDPSHLTAEMKSEYWTGYVATAKKTTEKLMVAGRPCMAWTLSLDKRVEKIWVNDSIYYGGTLDTLKLNQPAFLASGIRQIPLQTKRTHAEEVVTILQAVTITPGPQDKWLFKVPEGYRMLEFDPSELEHPIIKRKEQQ
jgi:hypothetical protein